LKWALHPSTIGIGGTLIIVQQLVEHFQKAQEKLFELRREQSALTTAVWDAQRAGIVSASDSAAEYVKVLGAVGASLDSLKGKEALEDAILAERIKQMQALRKASGQPELADSAIQQMQLEGLREQRDRRKAQQPELDQNAWEAERAKESSITGAGATTAAAAAKWLEMHKDSVSTAQAEVDKLKEQATNPSFSFNAAYHAREALPAAELALSKFREETEKNTATVAENTRHQKALADQAALTAGLRDANAAAINDTGAQINLREQVLGVTQTGEKKAARASMLKQFSESDLGGLGRFMPGAGAALAATASGHRADTADVVDYNKMLSELQNNRHIERTAMQDFIKKLTDIFRDGIVTPDEMKKLEHSVDTMRQRP